MRITVRLFGNVGVAFRGYYCAVLIASAQTISAVPQNITFTATADSLDLPSPSGFGIGGDSNSPGPTGFHYIGSEPATPAGLSYPNFVLIAPSAGVTPAFPESTGIGLALDPTVVPYMPSGDYVTFVSFAVNGQTTPGAAIMVTLNVNSVRPVIQSVVNAATLQPAISPGEIISIFGSHLGTAPVTAHYNAAGLYPTDLSHQNVPYPQGYDLSHDGVTFNGIAAPLLYYSSSQINAIVPYEVAGQTSVSVVITHNGSPTPAFPLPVSATSPGVFTTGQNGSGQGAILNAKWDAEQRIEPGTAGIGHNVFRHRRRRFATADRP